MLPYTYEIYALEIKSPLHIVGLEHKLSLDIRNVWRPINCSLMESPITHWKGLIIVRLFLVACLDRLHTSATNTLCSLLIVTGLIGVNAQYQPSVIGIPHRFLNTLCKPNPLNRVSTNRSPPTAGVISRYRLNSSRDSLESLVHPFHHDPYTAWASYDNTFTNADRSTSAWLRYWEPFTNRLTSSARQPDKCQLFSIWVHRLA